MATVELIELDAFVEEGLELLHSSWLEGGAIDLDAPTDHFDGDNMRTFVDYVACGRKTDPVTSQLDLEHRSAQQRADAQAVANGFTILRDYDSVIAVSPACPVRDTAIELYHIPNFKRGLKGTTHLKLQFSTDGGNHVAQDPASHTTCLFATFGASSRNDLYLCFPSEAAEALDSDGMQPSIFDAARETLAEVYPENAHEYAATFDAETARAPGNSSKIILSRWRVEEFITAFTKKLKDNCPWASSMYFLAQIRGVKDDFRHERACREALDRLWENIQTDDTTVVYVDVGLEVKVKQDAVEDEEDEVEEINWSSLPINDFDTHLRVMGIDPGSMQLVKRFTDLWCMTTDLSSFRFDATHRPGGVGSHHAVYGQIYVTDKFATHHAGKDRVLGTPAAIQIRPKDVLDMADKESYIHGTSKLVRIFNDNQLIPVHVRYELRVPVAHAHLALWGAENDNENIRVGNIDLRGAYALYQTVQVWGYRLINVVALIWIAKELAGISPRAQRSTDHCLVLAAGIAYLVNSTVARPSERSEWRAVAYAVFPHSDNQAIGRHFLWDLPRREPKMVPFFEHGKGWMLELMWPGPEGSNLRLVWARNRAFSDEQVLAIFTKRIPEIRTQFTHAPRLNVRDLGGQTRRVKAPLGLLVSDPEQPVAATAIIFNHTPGHDERGDLPAEDMVDERWMGDRHPTAVFVEVLSQLIQRSGVSKGESYSTLSLDQQRLVGLATFRDPNVLVYWKSRMVAWKQVKNFRL
ncbi:hypothetical protein C8R45DRAFT_1114686 [Mycena sanguinolenta]|nr:hypothetical protein C8R45DRAFT_1114686 [Mycena sanguinolenta]